MAIQKYHSKTLNKMVTIPGRYCACCDNQEISETNPKAQFLDLCDDCFRKLNVDPQSEIIGYRKCE